MPPKVQSSARRATRRSEIISDSPADVEDDKPTTEPSSSTAELRSDPLTISVNPDTLSTEAAATSASTSVTQQPADPDNSTSSRASAPRGRRRVAQPKFAGRRSQAKLQELQNAEDEKRKTEAAARAAEEASRVRRDGNRRGAGRGTGFGRGRGRGGYVDGGAREAPQAIASGPFGAAQASEEQAKAKKRWASASTSQKTHHPSSPPSASGSAGRSIAAKASSRQTTAKDGTVVKEESGPDRDISSFERQHINIEDGGYISSDEDEEVKTIQRLNVEDFKDEIEYDKFAPVRVARFAHRERAIGINADGATNHEGVVTVDTNDTASLPGPERKKAKPTPREAEVPVEKREFHATYSDSDDDGYDRHRAERTADAPQPVALPQTSLDLSKDRSSSPDTQRKAKGKIKARALSDELLPDLADYQTTDELEEWERHRKDLSLLRNVFEGPVSVGDRLDSDLSIGEMDKRANRVYLFQFPPVMPDLTPMTVKPDPDATNDRPDPMVVDEPTVPNADDPSKAPTQNKQATFASGVVGKLKVHASGRVTMDWGGTDLCMAMGASASFLQDVLVASPPESKAEDGKAQVGTAMGMGQVKGKFVVTPDWDEILK